VGNIARDRLNVGSLENTMKHNRRMAAVLAIAGIALTSGASLIAADLKSPDLVKTALKLLVQVSNDMKRQITNKNFARVPHEYQEYTEAADALRESIKGEPADFKTKVEARLKAAVTAAQRVSEMSATTTEVNKLMAEHAKVVTAMNGVFDLFPADLRPDPNAAPPGRRPPAQ
jgi:hypothetical protein